MDAHLLIAVVEIESIFEERGKDRLDAGMFALAEPLDDARLVGVRRLAKFTEGR